MKFSFNALVFSVFGICFSTAAIGQDYQLKDGLKYKIYTTHPGKKPKLGDIAMVDMLFFGGNDSLLYNSLEKGQPVSIPVKEPQFKGDLMQGIMMLSPGDSAVFLVNGDSVTKLTGQNSMIKPGSYLKYVIKLRSIFDPAAQKAKDIEAIKAYLKTKHIRGAKHLANGLYYTISKAGNGDLPKDGQTITAHYTGKFLDGKVFDDDKGAGFSFVLGKHEVIPGWEYGFSILKKGAKATIFLPSDLAYGTNGGGEIPPNAILVFDVELVDVK
jgi:FKBP-type peptidyl-prolyl cis-trans isomerase FkpA